MLQAFVDRDASAYETAYQRYWPLLYAAAFGVLRDQGAAADCVHDVLLRIWRRGNVYRTERGSLRAFLAVCVRNEALSRRRTTHNRQRLDDLHAPATTTPDFAESVSGRETLRAAMAGLSSPQRQTIAMAYYAGLTHQQIAERLGEPVGTVKSRLSASLRKLRETLQGGSDG